MRKNICRRFSVLLIHIAFALNATAQDIPAEQLEFISFPYPMNQKWRASLGFNLTTLAQDVTEELHLRVPCGDFHVLRKLSGHTHLDGRIQFQVFQNQLSLGPRWTFPLSHRTSVSFGDDIAWWFGFINREGFKTTGNGFQNYPNISLGYRFNKGILLTLREEAIMNLSVSAKTGSTPVTADYRLLGGSAFTATLEQPFYGNRSLSLGFRFVYTDFFWQTWALFPTFDRNIFYPQLLVAYIF